MICDTLATESFGSPAALAASSCTTRSGRRKPGSDRRARRVRPTRLAPVPLPSVWFDRTALCASDGRVEPTVLIGVDSIELVSGLASAMLGEIVGQGGRIQAAATEAKPLAKGFGCFEEFVRYRHGDFHTSVLPRWECGANRPGLNSTRTQRSSIVHTIGLTPEASRAKSVASDNDDLRNISDTARWVAIYRALESERKDAVFHDPFARRLGCVVRKSRQRATSIPELWTEISFFRLLSEESSQRRSSGWHRRYGGAIERHDFLWLFSRQVWVRSLPMGPSPNETLTSPVSSSDSRGSRPRPWPWVRGCCS